MLGILWPSAIFSLEPQCCDLPQGLLNSVSDTSGFLRVQNTAIAALVSLAHSRRSLQHLRTTALGQFT